MKKVIVQAIAILVIAIPVKANLVENGGFELPRIAPNYEIITSSIPGWECTMGTGFEVQHRAVHANAGDPYEGDQHIELDGYDSSNMVQMLNTVAGASYILSFAYSPRPGTEETTNGIAVYWDGSLVGTVRESGSMLQNTSWTIMAYGNLIASSNETPLEFRDAGFSDSFGSYIDDIQVIPEPATLLLFGLGMMLMRRRRVQ